MDTAQILLITVVSVLTLLLVLLGVQVFFILREVKNTLSKANKVLDDANVISSSISRPVESFSTVLSSVKLGSVIASFLAKVVEKTHDKNKEERHGQRE
ncbi:MAG TPA: hypothetical protein VF189_02000 [Patescibacteria group bacterium]